MAKKKREIVMYTKILVELSGEYALLYQKTLKDTGMNPTKLIKAMLDLYASTNPKAAK